MRINSLSSYDSFSSHTGLKSQTLSSISPNATGVFCVPAKYGHFSDVINFTGGYSINLSETVENLSKGAYPPDIRENALRTVEEGNPECKTLIDIHKEKYGIISEMETLDEVKEAFPEFSGVLSDEKVEYKNGSFIDDVKNDKVEAFDPDEDLALQLIKMYWAEGFSLNDLKEYTNGKNIFGVLEKLNIPRLSTTYGNVLKLSNKEYNERMSLLMSQKQKEAAVRRAEKQDGVYIPRGPITEEHKKKISEGLIKYYGEHPDKVSQMSERMKKYYTDHPEEKEKFARVLQTAWGLREARSVRKSMSKFFGKKDISPKEFFDMNFTSYTKEGRDIKSFWNKCPWAKEVWSKCMKKAWGRVQDEEKRKTEPDYIIKLYPDSMKRNMLRWMKANNYDVTKISDKNLTALYYGDKPVPPSDKYASNAVDAYFESDVSRQNLMADIYHTCIIKTITELAFDKQFTAKNKKQPHYDAFVKSAMPLLVERNGGLRDFTATEARNLYLTFMITCYKNGDDEVAQRFQENIEKSFDILQDPDGKEMQNVLTRAGLLVNICS